MSSVYKITEIVGTSSVSFAEAAKAGVAPNAMATMTRNKTGHLSRMSLRLQAVL